MPPLPDFVCARFAATWLAHGRHWCLLIAALSIASTAHAGEPTHWQLDAKRSRLLFGVQLMGNEFAGSFDAFETDIRFDPDDPASGSIVADIDMSAISTGMGEADEALPTPTWFDVQRHASARFTASNIEAVEGGFEGDAVLTVKGHELKLRFPFAWSGDAGESRLEAAVEMDRRAFDVGNGEFDSDDTVGYTVIVHVDVFVSAR